MNRLELATPEYSRHAFEFVVLARRRAGMSRPDAQRYVKQVHGEMVVDYIRYQPDSAPTRYVQNHVFLGTQRRIEGSPRAFPNYDFVTQLCFDALDHVGVALRAPFYREILQPDEECLIDARSAIKLPIAQRHSVVTRSQGAHFKLFRFLKRSAAASPREFTAAWDEDSAALLALPLADRIARYTRHVPLTRRGDGSSVHGLDELWLTSREAVEQLLVAAGALGGGGAAECAIDRKGTFLLAAEEFVLFPG